MIDDNVLIKYGPHIILICITTYYFLSKYLEHFLYKDSDDQTSQKE